MEEITAFAPASVSNLGPGFDVLGMALGGIGDEVTVRRSSESGVRIARIEGDDGVLPRLAARNTAGVAAMATLELAGVAVGLELDLRKGLPIGSGLGSSAASAVAAAFATNALIGGPLRKRDLIGPCLEAEGLVSGRHGDNVAPSLLGGLVLVRSLDPLDLVRLPVPEGLWLAVVTPKFILETRHARGVLPKEVPLQAMVANSANLGAFVTACHTSDLTLLSRAIVDDVVAPCRMALIPGAQEAVEVALAGGALGSSVSGAGPSVFALCRSRSHALEVGGTMVQAFADAGQESRCHVALADCPGAGLR